MEVLQDHQPQPVELITVTRTTATTTATAPQQQQYQSTTNNITAKKMNENSIEGSRGYQYNFFDSNSLYCNKLRDDSISIDRIF